MGGRNFIVRCSSAKELILFVCSNYWFIISRINSSETEKLLFSKNIGILNSTLCGSARKQKKLNFKFPFHRRKKIDL